MTITELSLTDAERDRIDHVDRLMATGAAGVAALVDALEEPSWTVRRAVVAALAALGDDAVSALDRRLRDHRSSEHAIAAAVDALVASNGATVSAVLAQMMAPGDAPIVADAIAIAGRRGQVDLAPRIVELLDDADDNVAVAAIEALGRLGAGLAVEPLIAIVDRRSFFRTFPAIQVLAATQDVRAISPLAALVDDELFGDACMTGLGRTGLPQAAPPLVAMLDRRRPERTRRVVTALDELLVAAAWSGTTAGVVEALQSAPGTGDVLRAVLPGASSSERAALAKLLGTLQDPANLAALIELVDGADPFARTAACAAIRQIAAAHEDALVAALARAGPSTRVALLPIVKTSHALAVVRELLRDEEPEVRARACDALARIGDTSVVAELFEALADDNPRVAHAASGAIQSLGTEEARRLTIDTLASGAPAVRRRAMRIVAYLGIREAFEAVRAALGDDDRKLAELAVAALGSIDDSRCEPLLREIARGPEEPMRAAAIRAASHRGSAMNDLLLRALADDAAWVRYYACQGLGRQGGAAATNALVGRLADAYPHVRIAAIEALAELETPLAWQALASAARSDDPDERRAALVGISHAAPAGALPLLVAAVSSEDIATRLVALQGLARIPGARALAVLVAAARGDDDAIRDAAVSLLCESVDEHAAEALVHLAIESAPKHPVHLALSRFTPARVDAIVARLDGADDRAAPVLAAALARMDHPRAIGALAKALTATSPATRRCVATTLIALGIASARAPVEHLATHDPDHGVRHACRAAIERR